MQITHDEARRLIQFHADGPLPENEQSMVDMHLAFCREFRSYADSILEMEAILQPLMQKQWSTQTSSFPIRAAVSRRPSRVTRDILMFTRILAMSVICATFLFNNHANQRLPELHGRVLVVMAARRTRRAVLMVVVVAVGMVVLVAAQE